MGWNTTDIDWTDINTLYGVNPYICLHDLVNAANERRAVTNRRYSSSYFFQPLPYGYTLHKVLNSLYTFVDDSFTTWIGGFIDPTYNDGNYSGEDNIPCWTLSTIEEDIGFSRPDISDGSFVDLALACQWLYHCFNRFVWTRHTLDVVGLYYKSGFGSDYTQAKADFDISSWTYSAANYDTAFSEGTTTHYSDGYWSLARRGIKATAVRVRPTEYSYDLDFYLTGRNDFYIYSRRYYIHNFGGEGVELNKLILAGQAFNVTGEYVTRDLMKIEDYPPIDPPAMPVYGRAGWYARPNGDDFTYSKDVVAKYDVPGGFEYVAP